MKRVLWILWPSFLVAAAAEMTFVVLFDPIELGIVGAILGVGHLAGYSVGFLLFWFFAAASSALTLFLRGNR